MSEDEMRKAADEYIGFAPQPWEAHETTVARKAFIDGLKYANNKQNQNEQQ